MACHKKRIRVVLYGGVLQVNSANPDASAGGRLLATFEEHRGLLFSIAYRMLGSRADAEDILQETFLYLSTNTPKSPPC
jgi:DNA-directed RNA polymerase specialized sigma24 family protein